MGALEVVLVRFSSLDKEKSKRDKQWKQVKRGWIAGLCIAEAPASWIMLIMHKGPRQLVFYPWLSVLNPSFVPGRPIYNETHLHSHNSY